MRKAIEILESKANQSGINFRTFQNDMILLFTSMPFIKLI